MMTFTDDMNACETIAAGLFLQKQNCANKYGFFHSVLLLCT